MKKTAFTLAEVLITLTIIGVIAALTIPNLMQKYTKHQYVVGLKNAYADISNAMKMIPLTENCSAGDYDCAGWENNNMTANGQELDNNNAVKLYLLSKQFKIKEINYTCTNKNGGCFPSAYKYQKSKTLGTYGAGYFITDNGMMWFIGNISSNDGMKNILVDINGFKGPNKDGRDIFGFAYTTIETPMTKKNTLFPIGSAKAYAFSKEQGYWHPFMYWKEGASSGGSGYVCTEDIQSLSCTARVLDENAMNY